MTIMVKAWLDGGSSDPEAEVQVAEYIEDPALTNLVFWHNGVEGPGVLLDQQGLKDLIAGLQAHVTD